MNSKSTTLPLKCAENRNREEAGPSQEKRDNIAPAYPGLG
jgi:hypothetical protein